jgi:hypothetical protein
MVHPSIYINLHLSKTDESYQKIDAGKFGNARYRIMDASVKIGFGLKLYKHVLPTWHSGDKIIP